MSSASALLPPAQEQPLSIVLYRNRFSKHPIRISRTWREFVDFIVNFIETSHCTIADGVSRCIGKKCPYKSNSVHANNPMAWSPVEIEGLRLDKNVRALTLLTLDFDHVTAEQARQVLAALSGRAYVHHTTHNHRGDADACFRVILPLSRPVPANLWHKFLPAAIDLLRVTVQTSDSKGKVILQPDRVCKNRDRIYYRPSHPKDAAHLASAGEVKGAVLDVDAVLAHAATMPEPRAERASREIPEASDWNLESPAVEEAIDLIARYMPERQRHELALALGGMLRMHGAAQEDAHYILHEGFLAGGSDDPEERAKTVEHTYSLPTDAAMTGFTRVSEIIGVAEAREIGHCLAQAAQDEFLERLADADEPAPLPGAPPLPVAAPVSIREVADAISGLATHLARDTRHDVAILSVPLRRLLAGKAVGAVGGVGDVETVREGAQAGLDAEEALGEVFFRVGVHLEQPAAPTRAGEEALWAAVEQVARTSLASLSQLPGKDWPAIARAAFFRARSVKLSDAAARAKAELERSEAARRVVAAAAPPALPTAVPVGLPDGPEWDRFVTKNAGGVVESTLDNARLYLTNHPDFCGYLRFNVVTKTVEATGGVPAALAGADGFDALKVRLADYLARTYRITVDESKLARRIVDVALLRKYDPIAEYLESLRWDGVPRLDVWLRVYCGAELTDTNDEYLRMVSRRWPISLVARGVKVPGSASPSGPGCKVDHVLVLQGEGGIGKSAVFKAIAGDWFCDTVINLGDKDSRMMAGRYWLCEMPELIAFKKASHEMLKAFFSQEKDSFRLPYGSAIEESPRRCLFGATTNEDHYFGDQTGNRKYLSVKCFVTDEMVEALRRDRDQILAEAMHALRAGERWWFNRAEIVDTVEPENEGRMLETVVSIKVEEWWYALDKKERQAMLTTLDVAEQALDLEPAQIKDSDLQKIGYTLKKMGFNKRRDTSGTRRTWRYFATEKLLNAEKREPRRRGLFLVPGGKKDEENK